MTFDEEIEQEIKDKNLNAPRITPEHIDSVISRARYMVIEDTQMTICAVVLNNGFSVVGMSACASPENFDAELGRKIALKDAKDKIWPLEAYLLKQRMYEEFRK